MEEQLKALAQRAQASPPQSELRSQAVSDLAEAILRSRKVGRSPKGYPLAGVYQAIYQHLRQQLLQDVDQAITANFPQTSVMAWASQLQHRAYYAALDDALLKHLALEAQDHPPDSDLRRHALTQLVEAIRLSGRLARPHRTTFSPMFYDLLYEEAVNKTLTYVCRRIDTYDPARGQAKKFMNWVNFRLDRVIIECRREFGEQTDRVPTLSDLEAIPQPEEPPQSDTENVRDCIDADVDDIFKSAHIRNQPEANFRAIALERFTGKSWEDIANKHALKVPTLSSFYQRCCQKFAAEIKAYLEE